MNVKKSEGKVLECDMSVARETGREGVAAERKMVGIMSVQNRVPCGVEGAGPLVIYACISKKNCKYLEDHKA